MEHHAHYLHDADCSARRAMHAADTQLLFKLKPGIHFLAVLHSLSSYPGSKWLDTLSIVAFLRLDDQAFQDNARIPLRVHNSIMPHAWNCKCGQLVHGDEVAHTLGCDSLNSLDFSLHDETADTLRELAA
jgi:hypothetical protein